MENEKLSYAVIGTGGIGIYYGGLLARAGRDVHFLMHSDYEYVKQHGLQIDSVDGNYHLDRPQIHNDAAAMPCCDVVIVGLKTTRNNLLPQLLAKVADRHSIIILIQNGIGVEEDVQKMLPGAQLACGIAYICTTKTAPGTITHAANGRLIVGPYSIADTLLLDRAVTDMRDAGVKVTIGDYLETRWKKAVWNMPYNGMTVAMDADSMALTKHPAMGPLIRRMMTEVVNAARACGAGNIDESYADKMIALTESMPPYASSMKVDYDHHRPMEIHYLYERPIAEAKKHGFEMPLMGMLEAMLRFKDKDLG